MPDADGCSKGKCVGVVVVHGVGEAELGYAVNTLVNTLVDAFRDEFPSNHIAPHSEVLRLDEEESRRKISRRPRKFRVVRRRLKHTSGMRLVFQELYWADLTNLAPGRLSALFGIFRTIFESHHIVDGILDRKSGLGAALLRILLLTASWLMRGPIAGLTVSAAAVMALFVFGPVDAQSGWLGWFVILTPYAKFMIVQCILIAVAIFAVFRVFRYQDVSWYDTTFWLGIMAAGLMLIAATGFLPWFAERLSHLRPTLRLDSCSEHFTNDCFVNVPYLMIVAGWLIWYTLMAMAIATFAFLTLRAILRGQREAIGPLAASVGVIVLQFMLWTVVVVTSLFPVLSRGELVSALSVARIGGNEPLRPLLAQMPDVGNVPLNSLRELAQVPELVFPWIGPFKTVYALVSAAFIIALLIMIGVIMRRWFMARHFGAPGAAALTPHALPRLVFSPVLLAWLILSLSALVIVIFGDYHSLLTDKTLRGLLLGIASLVAISAPFLLSRIANIIHISRDLNDHLYKPSLETAYYFFPRAFRPLARYPRRRRIQARLIEMLKNVVEDQPYDAIVFVGHSQGSIVVFDYLARSEEPVEINGVPVSFLSMGSPVSSIYETYYHEYRQDSLKIETARSRLAKWVNLTRVDDYIGGHIAHERATEIENRVLAPGGHTDYWNLRDVALALHELIWHTVEVAQARRPS